MKLDLKRLTAAISRVMSVVPSDVIGLHLNKKVLHISADANGYSMQVKIPYAEAGGWEFTIPVATLNGVFKGRADLDMRVEDGTRVWFTNGKKFECDFATQPYSISAQLERSGAKEITDEQQDQLMLSLDLATLNAIHEKDTNFVVRLSNKACLAGCFDDLHFAFIESPGIKGTTLDFALPTSTFNIIAKAAAKGKYHMSATSAAICAWNDEFELIVPFVQQDVQQTIEDVQNMANSFGKGMAIIDRKEMLGALDAALVATEEGSPIKLELKEKGCEFSASSNSGNLTERVACKVRKTGKMDLNPIVTMNIMHNVPNGPIEIGVHNERFFFVRAVQDEHSVVYGGMLSSGDE